MIPRSIKANLARLRRRERLIRLAWGGCRWLALVLVLLLACGLLDYVIDRDQDTPWSVRYGMFGVQAAVALAAGVAFVLGPQLRRLRDRELALWVESRNARLQHRLITAVELNRPGAQTDGMSEELIAVVTHEAERLSAGLPFARVADHGRLGRGLALLAPVVLLALVPAVVWPELAFTLLARQGLADRDIPRLVQVENVTPEVWPVGEKLDLVFRVTGPVDEESTGVVAIRPEGQPRDVYELSFVKRAADGSALFDVALPGSTADLTFTARLADGRTRAPGRVHFVPRPVVVQHEAWVQLPAFCGTTPEGQRYEQPQGHGDVVGIAGASVRVAIRTQKPVRTALLEVRGPERGGVPAADDDAGPEVVRRNVALRIGPSGLDAEAVFDLRPDESSYRIVVADEYGFFNVPAPRRTLRLVPEEPPQVALLKDYFGADAGSDVDGIPVPIGYPIRIPYVANGAFGLGSARVLYRVLRKQESGNEAAEPGEWTHLPLPEVTSTPALGPFDPRRGVFQNSQFDDEVPFHAVPSPNPKLVLGRQLGGGRFFLKTGGLVDPQGRPVRLRKGDQVEYCVEVFARPRPGVVPSARSETRVANVVSEEEFAEWVNALQREEQELRKLEKGERGVFQK